jgi:hypothetical protein
MVDCLLSATCEPCALSGYIACYAEEGDEVETKLLLGDDDDLTYLDLLDLGDHGIPFQSHFYERWEDATSQEPSIAWLLESPHLEQYTCSRHTNDIDITRFTLDGKSVLVTACSPLIHILQASSQKRAVCLAGRYETSHFEKT